MAGCRGGVGGAHAAERWGAAFWVRVLGAAGRSGGEEQERYWDGDQQGGGRAD